MQTEATPPTPPPPMARLDECMDVVMEDQQMNDGLYRKPAPPPPLTSLFAPLGGQQQPIMAMRTTAAFDPAPSYNDVWVTAFGFNRNEVQLVLKELSKCGDICNWGYFSSSSSTNFIHIQYQNKHAAQRALLRSGELLSPALILGVKPLDPRHRLAIDEQLNGVTNQVPVSLPSMVESRASQRMDVLSETTPAPKTAVSKIVEFVFGL